MILRRRGVLLAVLALPALGACRRDADAGPEPAASIRTRSAARPADDAGVMFATTVSSRDGRVTTPRLPGGGWEWSEDSRVGDGFDMVEIKWRRDQAKTTVRLYAKEYDGPKETIETLLQRDWKRYYATIFLNVTSLDVRRRAHAGHAACHVVAEGRGIDGSPLRLIERYVPERGHLFLISAAGDPAALDALGASLYGWIEAVHFSELN